MEVLLRVLQVLMKWLYLLLIPLTKIFVPQRPNARRIPPIRHPILLMNLHQVLYNIQNKRITSKEVVNLYIERLKEVNPHINAIVEDRFRKALNEAVTVDKMISASSKDEIAAMFQKKPLLGVPFTVKESIGINGMKQAVGSLKRINMKCSRDSPAVSRLREAGAIPLLVSANPEYCFSVETFSYTNGRCVNTYDSHRTSGGSSGGEGALNGCGATLFGIGSDIAGSIRLPCMFNGIFGHKPSGDMVPITGHFPSSDDRLCRMMFQIGPMTRFAGDMSLILSVMAGGNTSILKLRDNIDLKNVKIYYAFGFTGLNGMLRVPVEPEIKKTISIAVRHFNGLGVATEHVDFEGFGDSLEIALSAIARLRQFPYIIDYDPHSKLLQALSEFLRSLIFKTEYTKEALVFELMRRAHAFMSKKKLKYYEKRGRNLKREIERLLGENGVLFFPTFHIPAFPHNTSLMTVWNIDYTLLFNALELPCTHIPMGFSTQGLPIGFQVVARSLNDRLCLKIAEELDRAFCGWLPPSEPHFEA